MKQTAFESLLEVKDKFPKLSESLEFRERMKKQEEEKAHSTHAQSCIDAANLILSVWKANPDIKASRDVIEKMFSGCLSYYRQRMYYYPDLSIVHDKDTRHYIVEKTASCPEETIFLYLQNFTKSELVSLDNSAISNIFKHLLSLDEVVPFFEWFFDDDTDRIRDIFPHIINAIKIYGSSKEMSDPVEIENFLNAAFNEKYYNESYIMNHYSVIMDILTKFNWRIQGAFQAHNPYLIHALFNAAMYSPIFDSKNHNGYTENQIKFFSVLYAYEVYNGGGRVSTRGSIPGYMKCKDRLGDLYQPVKSMLDNGYNFAQLYNRLKHRFADIF